MDPYSSGEDFVIKTRKPYTITKQRDRWTEEEHNRFLEALKLHGRAWQRIEEHIGTKTAVQIRSHAQKFFTKLEKEAVHKGVPIGHILDIEIPPPRPKRKPSNPYPRKVSVRALASEALVKGGNPVSTMCPSKTTLNLEKEHEDNGSFNTSNVVDSNTLDEKYGHHERINELKQSNNVETFPTADVQASPNYPRHVPVHILGGSLGMGPKHLSPDMASTESLFHQTSGVHGLQNPFINPVTSANSEHHSNASRSSIHQSCPSYHPIFTQIQNPENYRSCVPLSSTFASHIVSALLQNPAAHAAATFAATMWPYVNPEIPVEPSLSISKSGTSQSSQTSLTPSMAAIAAATVAAATAWWAAHGLLPLCTPFHHPGFTGSPISQGGAVNSEKRENRPDHLRDEQLDPDCSKTLHEHVSASKPQDLLSSDSEGSEGAKLTSGLDTADPAAQLADEAELHDASKCCNAGKQVDRSSCGSNTPSSSEVEADALEKHAKENEENHVKANEEAVKELDAIHPFGDPFGRRCRNTSTVNESWKEVSEEGRMAFQALFSREVLPQSFSPPLNSAKSNTDKDKDKVNAKEKDVVGLQLDCNGKTLITCSQKQGVEDNAFLTAQNREGGLRLNAELGHAKLKCQRTGFIPYKRCSAEAKGSKMSITCEDEDKGSKRLRLEGQAST